MRYPALVAILLLTACANTTVTTTVSTTATTTTTTTTAPPPPATTTTSATTTTAAPIAEPVVEGESPFSPLPTPDEELPHTFGDVLIGDNGLLYVGAVSPTERDHPNVTAFWHFDGSSWQRTMLADLLPPSVNVEYGQATNLATWKGQYVGFLTAFTDDYTGIPFLLTSTDGRSWEATNILAGGAGSFGSIHATPESPPWPGEVGVSFVTTTENEIVAVGWVSTDQGSAPTVWRSTDADSWSVTLLPNGGNDREWASRVAIGAAGWLLTANGPHHSTSLLWFSPDGTEWIEVGEAFVEEDAWWSIAGVAAGETSLVVTTADLGGEFTRTQRWRSTNGTDWAKVGDPEEGAEGPTDRPTTIGSTIYTLFQSEEALAIQKSTDGATWTTLAEFDPPADPWGEFYRLQTIGDELALIQFQANEDYSDNAVGIWFDSPVMDMVLVEPDDTLNMRDGVMAEIIGGLEPGTSGIVTTGRTDGAASSLWVEILHNGQLGWVNSLYLTEPIDDFLALDPTAVAAEFAEKVFRNGGAIGRYVGRKGLSVGHYDRPKHWTRNDDPMGDPTVYIWGCPECSPDPGPDHHATFADWVADGFLAAWDQADPAMEIGGPSLGNTDRFTSIRPDVRNLHYLSVHDPGGDDYNDWKTWYLYFEHVDGELVIVAIEADMWVP